MRKLMIGLLVALALSAPVLAENVTWEKKFTSAVPDSSALTLRSTGVYNHRLTWTGEGTRTTCSIKLEQSVDASTWSDLIAAQTCTTDGAATTTGYANFVRISVTALTGSGNTVYSRYDGTGAAESIGAAVTANAGTDLNTSALALNSTLAKLTLAPGVAIGTNTFSLTGGSVTTAAPTYTTGMLNPFSLNTKGGLRITLMDGAGAETGLAAAPLFIQQSTAGFTATVLQGTAAAGSGAWPIAITTTGDTVVKPGDSGNNAIRVNVVAGVAADVAEGSAAGTTPALIGLQAATVEATAVDAADAIKGRATLVGGILVQPLYLPGDGFQYAAASDIADTTWVTIKAGVASMYLCVTEISASNSDATVGTDVIVYSDDDGDVTDSAVVFRLHADKAGGGFTLGNGSGVLFCTTTVAYGLYAAMGTTSAQIALNVKGYRTKVVPIY